MHSLTIYLIPPKNKKGKNKEARTGWKIALHPICAHYNTHLIVQSEPTYIQLCQAAKCSQRSLLLDGISGYQSLNTHHYRIKVLLIIWAENSPLLTSACVRSNLSGHKGHNQEYFLIQLFIIKKNSVENKKKKQKPYNMSAPFVPLVFLLPVRKNGYFEQQWFRTVVPKGHFSPPLELNGFIMVVCTV